jgi:hypothetical protein
MIALFNEPQQIRQPDAGVIRGFALPLRKVKFLFFVSQKRPF